MQSDLLELKNICDTSVNWLRSVGIHSQDDLKNKGAVAAYLEIKKRGIRVSKVLLYALHGAMTNTHWNELDDTTKQQLLSQANNQPPSEPAQQTQSKIFS